MSLPAASSFDPTGRVAMNRLLIVGLALRVAVCGLASPFNSDRHLEVIDFIVTHHALPVSNALQQSYHPPLYYLLMVPLRLLSPSATWPLHVASLLVSCANLVLLRRMMDDPLVVAIGASRALRVVAFALVAMLGQFVMFGSFISNDPLTQLLGTLLFAACLRYVRTPSTRGVASLALLVALGLLTKGTFLLVGVALVPIIVRAESPRGGGRAMRVALAFCVAWLALGSFKYVDNTIRLGRPFVHNQEVWFAHDDAQSIWRGPSTIYDVNVAELIRNPIVRKRHPTSYPLTLYATFWYAHLGDSSFRGNVSGYDAIGRATYATAVVPTLIFALGIGVALSTVGRWIRVGDAAATLAVTSLALFTANLAVVIAAGVRFDTWEAFQGRLLFQSAMPLVALFLLGASRLPSWRWLQTIVMLACWSTAMFGVLYFLVEFALVAHLLNVDESILFAPTTLP